MAKKIFDSYDWKKTALKGMSIFVYSGIGSFLVFFTQALAEVPAIGILEILIVGVLTGGIAALQNYLKNRNNK